MAYYNLARMYTETTGTGTVTLTTAVPGCLTFALAGVSNGETVSYGMITYDLVTHRPTHSEVGTGTYTTSGTTLSRTVSKSTNSNAAIVLTGLTEVYLCPIASNFNSFIVSGGSVPFAKYTGASLTITNNTNDNVLTIDTEAVDASGLGTLASNLVTVAGSGWYRIYADVFITGASAFNGRVNVNLFTTPESPRKQEGYSTADAIDNDEIFISRTIQLSATNQVGLLLDNHLGESIDAYVLDLTLEKLS